jgi:hypothetical protein
VAEIYLAKDMKPAAPAPGGDEKAVQLPEEKLTDKVGTYLDPDGDQTRRVTRKEGKLRISPGGDEDSYELKALSETDFRLVIAPVDFKFESVKPGGPLRLIEKQGDGKPEVFESVPQFTPSADELNHYAGVYHSEEIEPLYEIKLEDGKLVLHRLKNKPDTLRPITHDLFAGSVGTIRFRRNAQGQVAGFALNGGRVRNFQFQRGSGRPPISGGLRTGGA